MKKTRSFVISGGLVIILLASLYARDLGLNSQSAGPSPDRAEICRFLERFHGHTCPGSLMGLRLGMAAKEALKGSGKLRAKCFALSCPVDGIQVGAGTTY